MTKTQASLPLSRFKVLDLTRVRAGPTAVRQLADWGANVIKVEKPSRPGEESGFASRHGPDFQNLHRNKRSMTLNLKDPEGLAIFKRMVEKADVVVENYRPEVKYRLGIDYESLKKVNARLVYASISGFGQNGPYRNLPGYDQVAQGLGGLMSITGLPGQGPVRTGIPIADLTSGLYCAIGILVALLEREVSGEGQWVHTSLLEAQIAMLDFQAVRWLMDKDIPQQAGNYHPTSVPTGVYPTRDGHINIAVAGSEIYKRFCQVIGREDWLDDPKFSTPEARYQNRDEMNATIAEITATRSSQEWV
ncbi:MAG: CoA transferase, partial [Phycisphaerae bacterium]|nr:CoA transferase [Phycisphaerae bacterium]NIX30132.1 CoA transferase [Phycisphaerae bacterium]